MNRSWRRLLVPIAAMLAVAGAVAFYFVSLGPPRVETVAATRGPAIQAVYATGQVEAVHWAKVTSLVAGRIVEICECEGRPIRKGEFLIKLDDREVLAELERLRAREAYLAGEVERHRRLLERKVVSIQAYSRVASERAEIKAAIAAAALRLGHYRIRAPMDGVVLRRDGEVGEVVQPGEIIMWVGKPRPLRITAEIDEEDIPLITVGQRAMIRSDAFPDQVLEGQIQHVTPKGDPRTKSYRVRISLSEDTPLRIGMTTEINVLIRKVANALLIPENALDGNRVWVVVNNRARARAVQIGIEGDGKVEVIEGVRDADRIIVDPPNGLRDGSRVREIYRE